MEIIGQEDIKIEILTENHDVSNFRSYEQELVNFLKEDALRNQKLSLSITFLWFHKENLVSYITLLNDRINLEGNLKLSFRDKSVLYKSLPALKIGRIAVDDRFLMRGIGSLMVSFARNVAIKMQKNYSGCRFITVDAKRNQEKSRDAIHFYKKIGFFPLKERAKGTTPMYLDLSLLS